MQLFANNADSSLNGAIASDTVVLVLKTGEGDKFPSPTNGDFFLVTLFQRVGTTELNHEIVKCTSRAGDNLTVVRAQEGTSAKSFNSGDLVELRVTAGTLDNKVEKVTGKSLSTEDFSSAEKTKLAAVAIGATANSTDAQLRDRATHTGVQAIASIAGLQSTLDSKVNKSGDIMTGTLVTKALQESRVALPANNIDLSAGNFFSKTIAGATALTVSNVPTAGTTASFILDLTNGGSATVTWWAGVKWSSGTAPTLTATGRDVLGFFTHDGGATWTGLILGKDMK